MPAIILMGVQALILIVGVQGMHPFLFIDLYDKKRLWVQGAAGFAKSLEGEENTEHVWVYAVYLY